MGDMQRLLHIARRVKHQVQISLHFLAMSPWLLMDCRVVGEFLNFGPGGAAKDTTLESITSVQETPLRQSVHPDSIEGKAAYCSSGSIRVTFRSEPSRANDSHFHQSFSFARPTVVGQTSWFGGSMRSACRGRLLKLLPGALFAFLGWLVVVPVAAEAGCTSHDRPLISLPDGSAIDLLRLDRAGQLAAADLTEKPRVPKPCSGAMCSGRPAIPVSPAPPQFLRIGLWVILDLALSVAAPEEIDSREDQSRICPIRFSLSIFHPPRLSPSHLAS
jgi:hypothetical protein